MNINLISILFNEFPPFWNVLNCEGSPCCGFWQMCTVGFSHTWISVRGLSLTRLERFAQKPNWFCLRSRRPNKHFLTHPTNLVEIGYIMAYYDTFHDQLWHLTFKFVSFVTSVTNVTNLCRVSQVWHPGHCDILWHNLCHNCTNMSDPTANCFWTWPSPKLSAKA
jgi:hypothetical protein